jgi:hypothetical protein
MSLPPRSTDCVMAATELTDVLDCVDMLVSLRLGGENEPSDRRKVIRYRTANPIGCYRNSVEHGQSYNVLSRKSRP